MRRLSAGLLDRESNAVWVPAFAGTTTGTFIGFL